MGKQAKILEYLKRPFKDYFCLLLCFFLLSTSAELFLCIQEKDVKAFLFSVAHGFVFSYLLVLIGSLFSSKIRLAFNVLFLTVLAVTCYIDWVCLIEFHSVFDPDFVSAMLGTDPSEVSEFVGIHLKGILVGLLVLALIALFYFLCSKFLPRMGNALSSVLLISLIPMILIFPLFPKAAQRIFYTKSFEGKIRGVISYIKTIPPRIPTQFAESTIRFDTDSLPANICIIFGESHCKQHCYFHGYDKNTMPLSQMMIEADSLLVYSNVTSSETTTIDSFRAMFSTYRPEYGDSVRFWESPSFFHVLHAAGYTESWLSNQSQRGLYDNLIGNYAALCDTTVFLGDKFAGMRRTNKDEELVPILQDLVSHSEGRNLYCIHLMGNHAEFGERYPENFSVFEETDYPDYPTEQRRILAEYDNSLLYTDYVINEMFDIFEDDEAVVFYVPDHGLDLFHTRPDYYLHALVANPESVSYAIQIPFLVYATDKYRARFPETVSRMEKARDNRFETEDLIYTIMDIAHISFTENDDVREYSLFSE